MTRLSATNCFDLDQRHADNLTAFSRQLNQCRFWHVLPAGAQDPSQAVGLFDRQTKLFYPPVAALQQFLQAHPFVYLQDAQSKKNLATLHLATRLLWNHETSATVYYLADGQKVVQQGRWAQLAGWRLPTNDQLFHFATESSNPHRLGNKYRMGIVGGAASYSWLTLQGRCDVDDGYWRIDSSQGNIFSIHPFWSGSSEAKMLMDLAIQGWLFKAPAGTVFEASPCWQGMNEEALLVHWLQAGSSLRAAEAEQADLTLLPENYVLMLQLQVLDYTPCRLPRLEPNQLNDPEKGLWELHGEAPATLQRHGMVARNPEQDLRDLAVAIDFGTSSTVVAIDTASGGRELLRIGLRDYFQPVQAQHFENPTVLECLDFAAFQSVWGSETHRPALDWNWMRAAHEAQANFRDNPGDTKVLASILPRLKQWAMRSGKQRVRLTDRKGVELELPEYSERNPVRGEPLHVQPQDPFDPIELYAWYLGMAINLRNRGLFLHYYLSFPVRYPREVKARILASFRRGLLRSLPATLIAQCPQSLQEFEVSELASEPAAYAAAALPHLKIEPSDQGVPYAVFDFGGGTTDFDFGLLRWADDAEEERGYERVFEHLASGGDNFLGGENLLEHLVYETFKANQDVLRKNRVQFTQPMDAAPFSGHEGLLAPTQSAQTNTVMLAAKLRPFMESPSGELTDTQIKLDLLDTHGNKVLCELMLDGEQLNRVLADRMRRGAEAFLLELSKVCADFPEGQAVHVLLAGNGSRSRHIQQLFDSAGSIWPELLTQIFGDHPPEIVVYPPLPANEADPYAPTNKTGVALGLLRLTPGKNVLLLDHVQRRHDGQAPFPWHVGRVRRGRMESKLLPGVSYGQWHELGPLQDGVFCLYFTTSPRAPMGLAEGDPELKMHRRSFRAAPADAILFARAVTPNRIELRPGLHLHDEDSHSVEVFELH